jgi:hypothetical protein
MFRYSSSRDAYILRGIGNTWGPVLKIDVPDAAHEEARHSAETTPHVNSNSKIHQLLQYFKVDFSPSHRQPATGRFVVASAVALVGSLVADAALVALGSKLFPSIKHYGHFQFHDYARLTVIGVIFACIAWPVVTRISSAPRWLFFRMAVVVTLVLFSPDFYILRQGQPFKAVAILLCMHVAIALVTYQALVRIAPARTKATVEPNFDGTS